MKYLIAAGLAVGGIAWYNRMKLLNAYRGLRNNNPLNIKRNGIAWEGMAADQPDDTFVKFTDPRYGYRAATHILNNYRRRGIVTLEQIVTTWAPPKGDDGEFENHTESYAAHVSQVTGIGLQEVVTEHDYARLFAVMTKHENGINPYSVAFIQEGVSWA